METLVSLQLPGAEDPPLRQKVKKYGERDYELRPAFIE